MFAFPLTIRLLKAYNIYTMNKIIKKTQLSENVIRLEVEAPLIAQERKAGQFIILMVDDNFGERIPLTIADADKEKGTITLIYQTVGATTMKLAKLGEGDYIADLLGPLGRPTSIRGANGEKPGRVVCVGGGIGVAPMHPIAQALKEAGNEVTIIMGARNKDLFVMTEEMRAIAGDKLILMTDDGSSGRKGLVTEPLKELCEQGAVDEVIAIGPPIMMKFCALTTKPFNVPTTVSLNTVMIDGTGMCGGCRVTVGGETKFVCVDGPEFDAHQVDWDQMMKRMGAFKREEAIEKEHVCNAGIFGKGLTAKEKMAIPPQPMPEQPPEVRAHNMKEVALGYTAEMAKKEASRCMQCPTKPCMKGCPVAINIPGFLQKAAEGDFAGALKIIKQTSLLPAVCGRVCPQEKQCQKFCTMGKLLKDVDKAVAIGRVERFCADLARTEGGEEPTVCAPASGKKVAVIGSGPASITVAADCARAGHAVTMFEAFHKAGGVLVYGIPEFRLPKAIVQNEIDGLKKLGVKLETNFVVGRTRKLKDLMEKDGFDAVFIGSGAGLPKFMGIEGENLTGVFSANEYLTRANLMKAYDEEHSFTPFWHGKKVAVLGGGNVAMDASRMALRLGAEKVYLIYRRSEAEMPARIEEVHHAKQEGVEFRTLQNAKRILGDEQGRVNGIECLKYELGEPDASGRRSPVAVEGSEFTLDVDTVVVAVGNASNPLIPATTEGLEVNKRGNIVVNPETNQTSIPGVFAGGDIVLGAATVILAMGEGRRAAAGINAYLSGK